MTFDFKSLARLKMAAVIACILCAGSLIAPSSNAQFKLILDVGDTTAPLGLHNTKVPVYLTSPFSAPYDTVVGLNIWIQCDRPDILTFQGDPGTRIDTTYWKCLTYQGANCVDSVQTIPSAQWNFIHVDTVAILIGNFDTVGTRLSGWELVSAVSLTGTGTDINVVALADNSPIGGPYRPGLLPPFSSAIPLLKLNADVLSIPDTMQDRTVNLLVQYSILDHISFSRPNGTSIGIAYKQYLDTNLWVCTSWAGENCLIWERTSFPPFDSMEVIQDSFPYLDTTKVIISHGSLTIEEPPPWVCGNVNGTVSGAVNVSDITYLVRYLFRGGPAPVPVLAVGNVNCTASGAVNVADVTYLVKFLFQSGPPLCPTCK
jgi:hypothetical protein